MYHFVRGKGWLLLPDCAYTEITMNCGTKVRIEARHPEIGERYRTSGNNSVTDNGLPDYDWLNTIQTRRFDSCRVWAADSPKINLAVITVVPC